MRLYTTSKALLTTYQVKIIKNKKYTKIVLNKNVKAFLISVAFLNLSLILIYRAWKTQITLLYAKNIIFLLLYLNFIEIF